MTVTIDVGEVVAFTCDFCGAHQRKVCPIDFQTTPEGWLAHVHTNGNTAGHACPVCLVPAALRHLDLLLTGTMRAVEAYPRVSDCLPLAVVPLSDGLTTLKLGIKGGWGIVEMENATVGVSDKLRSAYAAGRSRTQVWVLCEAIKMALWRQLKARQAPDGSC
jgi:hypothetical protein